MFAQKLLISLQDWKEEKSVKSRNMTYHNLQNIHTNSQIIIPFPSLKSFAKLYSEKGMTEIITPALKRFHQNSFMAAELC